ncbi:MAG TPA: hypothetical protein VEA78_13500 [Acidimicrobiales bacterium]|nr:hypothetical protein [Acidimicrobiales bacterium]
MQTWVRRLAWSHALFRTTVAAALLTDAGRTATRWLGPDVRRGGGRVALRAFAIRDLVIGLGILRLLAQRKPVRLWFGLGILLEAVDSSDTVRNRADLPPGAFPTSFAAIGAWGAVSGAAIALLLDDDS